MILLFTLKRVYPLERILFDFRTMNFFPKLTDFFDTCLAPEIISPIHGLGYSCTKPT